MAPEHAFDGLYRRYARDVYRFAYGLVRNRADAEDVAQTAFLNAYRALERGHAPESPRNWLLAIAQNVYRQRLRRSQRRVQEVALDVELAEAIAVEENTALDPSDISRALGHLAPNQRAALILREVEGRSYAEIATALDVSVSAVETLIFRGRRALREQLEASLTCAQAERLIADGGRSRQLRPHLRECAACRTLARSTRARRAGLRSLFGLPWLGSGTGAVATKVAAVVIATGIAGGLTQLLEPRTAQPAASERVQHTSAAMPIEAVLAVSDAPRPRRHAVVRHQLRRVAVTTPVAAAPVHAVVRPDDEPTTTAAAVPPAAHPPAPAPSATTTPAAPTTSITTTTSVTTTTSATTVEVQTPPLGPVPPVTVTVTLPSLPGLTDNSQNSSARNPALGHLNP